MGKLTVNVSALEGAVEKLTTLGDDVEDARHRALGAIPRGMSISTLASTGPAAAFSTWIEEQVASPLTVVLDIARLLDTQGSGNVIYTFDGPFSIATLNADLGDMVAARLENATSQGDIEKYLDIATSHVDSSDFQDAFLAGLGPAGVATVLTRAGDRGIPMGQVTEAFSADSQDEIAGWVRDDIVDQDIDLETTTLLAGFARSADFSTSLYSDVTPAQMSDAIEHLNHATYSPTEPPYSGPPGDSIDTDALEIYQQFINSAGTSFATYTQGVSDPESLAGEWFDAITDDDDPGQASALTLLIRKGGEHAAFDPDFLFTLTDDIYEWERDQDGAVWRPRDEGVPLLDPDIADPDVVGFDPYEFRFDASRKDGLANLLGSMEYTPEAAQKFFAEGYENGDPGGDNSRIEYLMMDRTFAQVRGSDDGYGLGVALEAAATGNMTSEYIPGIGASDEWSAGFATDLFEFVAHHEDAKTGDSGWQPNVLGDDRYHGYPGTSVALGNIAAGYSDDVYELLRDTGEQYGDGKTLAIDRAQLLQVLGQVGYHDDMSGLETVSAAMMTEGNERFRSLLDDRPPPHTLESLQGFDVTGVLDANGEVMGNLLDAGLADKYEGEELAKQRAALAAKAFDIATNFVPGAGDIAAGLKDTLWETAIDTGKDEGLDALKGLVANSPDYTADQYAGREDNQFQPLVRYNTYDQLLASGYLDTYDFPDEMITGEGENRRFREDIRFEGVGGLPDDMDQATRDDIDDWMKLLLSNDPDENGPGAHLQGMISQALNGYDRVRPPK